MSGPSLGATEPWCLASGTPRLCPQRGVGNNDRHFSLPPHPGLHQEATQKCEAQRQLPDSLWSQPCLGGESLHIMAQREVFLPPSSSAYPGIPQFPLKEVAPGCTGWGLSSQDPVEPRGRAGPPSLQGRGSKGRQALGRLARGQRESACSLASARAVGLGRMGSGAIPGPGEETEGGDRGGSLSGCGAWGGAPPPAPGGGGGAEHVAFPGCL